VFATDPHLKAAVTISNNQTRVVEREREKGNDISHIAGLSAKTHAERISVKQFAIYSRAGLKL
jgi:hypothetical protein